jgi:hypothetical protein
VLEEEAILRKQLDLKFDLFWDLSGACPVLWILPLNP